jgi:hypothetical protein
MGLLQKSLSGPIHPNTVRPAMIKLRFVSLFCLISGAISGLALGADEASDSVAVPEPSALVFGGLCGLLFLFWRSK